jgi:hypothetical protein
MAGEPDQPVQNDKVRGARHPARAIRNYLIAGLLIWVPIMVTVWVVRFIARILDQSLLLLPPSRDCSGITFPGSASSCRCCCCSSPACWSATCSGARSSTAPNH